MRAYAVAPLGAQWSSTASRATVVASMRVLKWHGTESTASGGGGAAHHTKWPRVQHESHGGSP